MDHAVGYISIFFIISKMFMNRILMMNKAVLLISLCSCLVCCQDNVLDNDGQTIDPINVQNHEGVFSYELQIALENDLLIRQVLNKSGSETQEDYAYVINRQRDLQDAKWGDETYCWPEIDFNEYSLVVGQFRTRSHGYGISRQYVRKGLFKYTLHLEIQSFVDIHNFEPKTNYFASLYPKLPDGRLEVKCVGDH